MEKFKKGFTLVELLVVMAILAILASISFGQYRTSQKKARDAQRKSDLDNLARALEMYYNDSRSYPLSSDAVINWGDPLQKVFGSETVIYMKRIPQDPEINRDYCYFSDGTGYSIYAKLENENDSEYNEHCISGYGCNSGVYSYAVTSSNEEPTCNTP